jgi:quercetin dioxygenase-like cupin family protein
MATGTTHHRWAASAAETLNPDVERRYINTGLVTLAHFTLKRGGLVPRHSHENEQITSVLSGRLRFVLDDGEVIVGAGETITLAPSVAHEVEVLEDTLALDVFAPVRADWVAGTDDYFRRTAAASS